jgi:hypothetical protein
VLFIYFNKKTRMVGACTVLCSLTNALPNIVVVMNGSFIQRVSQRLFLVGEHLLTRKTIVVKP